MMDPAEKETYVLSRSPAMPALAGVMLALSAGWSSPRGFRERPKGSEGRRHARRKRNTKNAIAAQSRKRNRR